MTKEEAIRILASSCIPGSKQTEALETLIPELKESEDKRMMREFNDWLCEEIECLQNDLRDEEDRKTLNMLCYVLTKVKDWLEKQKEVGINWMKSDNVKNPNKPYIDKAGMFYTTDGRMCYASEIERQKGQGLTAKINGEPIPTKNYSVNIPLAEWSEEDEKIAKEIEEELWYPGDFPDYPSKEESKLYDDCQRRLNWFKNKLKSLRLQPKQEWSEEDERIRKEIYNFFKNFKETGTWKSISDVNTWLAYLEKQKEQKIDIDKEKLIRHCIGLILTDATDKRFKDYGLTLKDCLTWLGEQKEQKPELPKLHKGDDNNPYDMRVSEAQEYAINRGFGIPYNDGEVYVDERHMTQTIGNILRWADEHPKEQKPVDYEAELKKCKDNPLYFYDKYVSIKQKPAEWKATLNGESIPTENQSVEIPLAEWSDDDSDNLERVENYLWMLDDYVGDDCAMPQGKTDKIRENIQEILLPWLKSLPKRFNLQLKQEWSDEEYGRLFDIEHYLDGTLQLSPDRRIACINFLKSLYNF